MAGHPACYAIRQMVLHCLAQRQLHTAVVHSTSWRQEDEAVVLTHLAVVRAPTCAIAGLHEDPAVRRPLARGTPICPPPRVEVDQVLEHALRHLAWLSLDDSEISSALDDGWRTGLRSHRPEPCRAFESMTALCDAM